MRNDTDEFPYDLFYMMQANDDEGFSDGVWQQLLEDTVDFYNDMYETDFDPHKAFQAYLQWKE